MRPVASHSELGHTTNSGRIGGRVYLIIPLESLTQHTCFSREHGVGGACRNRVVDGRVAGIYARLRCLIRGNPLDVLGEIELLTWHSARLPPKLARDMHELRCYQARTSLLAARQLVPRRV